MALAETKSLPQTQAALGFTDYTWDGDCVCFSNAANVIRFYQGRRRSEINDTVVWMNEAPEGNVNAGEWRIAALDLDFLVLSILPKDCNAIKPLRVVLDAGHGGMDSGARSRAPEVSEKKLTLDLAKKVGQRLEDMGMHVVYTRTNDVAFDLGDRARVARKTSADVFVSIHANFAGNTNACGPETYVVTPAGLAGTSEGSRARGFQIGNANDYHNTLLGYSMQRHLARVDSGVVDRGLKRQSFFVLREVSCPSVLVEVGFLSNEAEAKKMMTKKWQNDCADAIMRGVIEYARKVDTLTLAVNEKRQRAQAQVAKASPSQGPPRPSGTPPQEGNLAAKENSPPAEGWMATKEPDGVVPPIPTPSPIAGAKRPVAATPPPAKPTNPVNPVKEAAAPPPAEKVKVADPPHKPKLPENPQTVFDFYP